MSNDVFQFLPYTVVFILLPIIVFMVISRMSGWSRLAEVYRFDGDFEGTRFNFVSARIGIMNFNNIIFLRTSTRGLFVSVPFPFKVFSPSLVIPWDDIVVEGVTGLLKNLILFNFRRRDEVRFSLPKKDAFKILREAEKNGFILKDANHQPYVVPE